MTNGRFAGLCEIGRELNVGFTDTSPPHDIELEGADGNRLHALDWQAPSRHAPKVLLLHGGALTAQTWDFACLGLRDRFHCVALDLRGHGESDWCETYSIDAHTNDIAAALSRLDWEQVHLAGMSLGGVVAAHAADRVTERVASLALVDVGPGVKFEASATLRSFISGLGHARNVGEVTDAAMKIARNKNRALVDYRMRALLRQGGDGLWRWKRDNRREVDYAQILAHVAAMAVIAEHFPNPALVIRGGDSLIFSEEAATLFAARFARGRYVTVPDAGHNVQEDNPAGLVAALRSFWR